MFGDIPGKSGTPNGSPDSPPAPPIGLRTSPESTRPPPPPSANVTESTRPTTGCAGAVTICVTVVPRRSPFPAPPPLLPGVLAQPAPATASVASMSTTNPRAFIPVSIISGMF
ncbi:hypothetical protein Ga0100230_021270 [Opitutaceae bacterium TAV3]|nr:hypothetical protein Ga0100230_021270 [Opitutaceae bacterium TAV3]